MTAERCATCGAVFPEATPGCSECAHRLGRQEIRRLPYEVVLALLDHGEEFLRSTPDRQAALALGAGSFIAFGALLSVVLTVGVEPAGLSRLLLGLGFSTGFIMVVLSGTALFTEVNVLLPEVFLSRPRELCRRCWRFWIITYYSNVAGALLVGLLIAGADILRPAQEMRLFELMNEKIAFKADGTEGWFKVLLSGVMGNWLVGMAAFLAAAARTVPGKILGVVFPIVAFVAIGFQHSPANVGYFAIGLIDGGSGVSWGDAIWWNVVPATIGNMIGGVVMVALPFWYTYGRNPEQREKLRRRVQQR